MKALILGSCLSLVACATTDDPLKGTNTTHSKTNSLQVEDPDFATCPKRAENLMAAYPKLIKQASCFTAKAKISCSEDDPNKCDYEDRSYLTANFLKATSLKRYEKAMKKDLGCAAWLDKMAKKFESSYLVSEEIGTEDEWICMVHTFSNEKKTK